jgi:hypothetical protein
VVICFRSSELHLSSVMLHSVSFSSSLFFGSLYSSKVLRAIGAIDYHNLVVNRRNEKRDPRKFNNSGTSINLVLGP